MKFLTNVFCGTVAMLILLAGWDVDVEQVGVFKCILAWVLANIALSVPQLFKIS